MTCSHGSCVILGLLCFTKRSCNSRELSKSYRNRTVAGSVSPGATLVTQGFARGAGSERGPENRQKGRRIRRQARRSGERTPVSGPVPRSPFCLERSSRGVPGHDTTGRKALSVSGARGPIPVMGPSERGGRVWSSWPWAHLPSEAGRAGGMALPSGPRAV